VKILQNNQLAHVNGGFVFSPQGCVGGIIMGAIFSTIYLTRYPSEGLQPIDSELLKDSRINGYVAGIKPQITMIYEDSIPYALGFIAGKTEGEDSL